MNIRKRGLSFCMAILFAFGVSEAPNVLGASDLSPQQIREAHQTGEIKSLRWVLKKVPPQYRGRILDVVLIKNKKKVHHYVYKIKILQDDGYIVKLYVDANTAEVLRVKSRRGHHQQKSRKD